MDSTQNCRTAVLPVNDDPVLKKFNDSGVRISHVGVRFDREVTRSEWAELGRAILSYETDWQIPWFDWVSYGKERWGADWTVEYDAGAIAYETIKAAYYTVRAFPYEQRRADAKYTHYFIAIRAPRNQRKEALDHILDAKLTYKQAQEYVRGLCKAWNSRALPTIQKRKKKAFDPFRHWARSHIGEDYETRSYGEMEMRDSFNAGASWVKRYTTMKKIVEQRRRKQDIERKAKKAQSARAALEAMKQAGEC